MYIKERKSSFTRGEGTRIQNNRKERQFLLHLLQIFPLPKKNMKKNYAGKAAAVTMAAAMMVSMMGATAFAADDTKDTTVKYTVQQGYEWSIPTEIEFTDSVDTVTTDGTSGKTQNVYVSKNVINNGKMLQIDLNNPTFTITTSAEQGSAELTYTVYHEDYKKELSTTSTLVLQQNAGSQGGSAQLTFKLKKDTVEKAGDYTGTLSFIASIVDYQE